MFEFMMMDVRCGYLVLWCGFTWYLAGVSFRVVAEKARGPRAGHAWWV